MLNEIRNYLGIAGLQNRNPDKAGEEREKCRVFRHKRSRGTKGFLQNLAKVQQPSRMAAPNKPVMDESSSKELFIINIFGFIYREI